MTKPRPNAGTGPLNQVSDLRKQTELRISTEFPPYAEGTHKITKLKIDEQESPRQYRLTHLLLGILVLKQVPVGGIQLAAKDQETLEILPTIHGKGPQLTD